MRTPTAPEPPGLLPSQRSERAVTAEAALREALIRIDTLQADLENARGRIRSLSNRLARYEAGPSMRSRS
jgi:multidrug resistance efflux pump